MPFSITQTEIWSSPSMTCWICRMVMYNIITEIAKLFLLYGLLNMVITTNVISKFEASEIQDTVIFSTVFQHSTFDLLSEN